MTDYPRRQIESLRDRLDTWERAARRAGDDEAVADIAVLRRMSDEIDLLGPSKYSDQRHEFLVKRCVRMAEAVGGLADALEDRAATERIVRWINTEQNNSPETNKDYRVSLRMFGDLVTEGEGKPDSIEWVPGGYPKNYDPMPDPAKMFQWEEHIQPMLAACTNSRDRALIALAWDLGPRPRELFELTTDRFSDHKYGLKVTLEGGKRGSRAPLLNPSIPYVQDWLTDHAASQADAAPLWTPIGKTRKLSNNRIRDILKERAAAADMTPPSTPTPRRMRKSSASFLASRGVSQPHIEDHHGWDRGSEVAARYISVFGDANDRAIASAHGIDVSEDEPEPVGPVECPRCDRETPRDLPSCMWCGAVLSPEAAEAADTVDSMLTDDMASGETAEARGVARGVYESIRDDPEFRAEVLDRVLHDRPSSPE